MSHAWAVFRTKPSFLLLTLLSPWVVTHICSLCCCHRPPCAPANVFIPFSLQLRVCLGQIPVEANLPSLLPLPRCLPWNSLCLGFLPHPPLPSHCLSDLREGEENLGTEQHTVKLKILKTFFKICIYLVKKTHCYPLAHSPDACKNWDWTVWELGAHLRSLP